MPSFNASRKVMKASVAAMYDCADAAPAVGAAWEACAGCGDA
jgi:hypothetical protein